MGTGLYGSPDLNPIPLVRIGGQVRQNGAGQDIGFEPELTGAVAGIARSETRMHASACLDAERRGR